MNRRWICPQCGNGINAPERMRKDDTRRFCLRCTVRSPRLVERTCPARDRQVTQRAAKRAGKQQQEAARARAAEVAARTAGPYDLGALAKRFQRLPVFKDTHLGRRGLPPITFRHHREGWKSFTSGHYEVGVGITITIGTDPHGAVETLLHELVHASLPLEAHTERFWRRLQQAAREAYPAARYDFLGGRARGPSCDEAIGYGIEQLWLSQQGDES